MCPENEAIDNDGRFAPATPDQITDGVCMVDGVYVDGVGNRDPVVTCGVNGMALNDRSAVDRQIAEEKMSLHGPGDSGFANAGIANGPRSDAPHPRIPEAVMQRARRGADHG
ncbi:hypothetical protein [Azospirillum sp.]|uniref:hypothetical protein n=1 Tax=Azospirillum sp. TaxID=34012 RepID=UPI003D70D110